MRRFAILGRFLVAHSSGVTALRRALLLYLTIGIFSVLLFPGSRGLDAATVVSIAEQTPAARFRTETAAEWMLAWCGTNVTQRRVATMGLLAAAGGVLGLLVGALLGVVFGHAMPGRVALTAALALSGAALSALTEISVRRAMQESGRDGGRLVLALLALIAVAEGTVWLFWP